MSGYDGRGQNQGERVATIATDLPLCRANAYRCAAYMREHARIYRYREDAVECYGFRLSGDQRPLPEGWELA